MAKPCCVQNPNPQGGIETNRRAAISRTDRRAHILYDKVIASPISLSLGPEVLGPGWEPENSRRWTLAQEIVAKKCGDFAASTN